MKHSNLASLKRPLMKAVILRDTDLWGTWEQHEYIDFEVQETKEQSKEELEA
jgi:hypothetical protein